MKEMKGQVSIFDLGILCGRTSQVPCQVPAKTEQEKTSERYWKSWRGSSKKESLFLDLRKASGAIQDASSATDTQSRGVSWIASTGVFRNADEGLRSLLTSEDGTHLALFLEKSHREEWPTVVVNTHLSDILELMADKKYHLSAKACQGILNRAERRGKQLPPMLKEALLQTIERESASMDTTET
jgi:hypothetical protein